MGARLNKMNRPLDEGTLQAALRRVLPRANNSGVIDLTELRSELMAFGIDTPLRLRALMLAHRHEALRIDREPFDKLNERIQRAELGDQRYAHISQRGLFFNWAGLVRLALELHFGNRYRAFRVRTDRGASNAV